MTEAPRCLECGRAAAVAEGWAVYPDRPERAGDWVWVCTCGARVGCHKGTKTPLGRPAGPETLRLRERAHRVFDVIWKTDVRRDPGAGRRRHRDAAYHWLARELGLPRPDVHMGLMDRATLERVIAICTPIADRIRRRTPTPTIDNPVEAFISRRRPRRPGSRRKRREPPS